MNESPCHPHVSADDINDIKWLETTLRNADSWRHADELLTAKNEFQTPANRRWMLALASQSEWIISGNYGYLHVACATADELDHFVARMQSQVDVMKARIAAVHRNKNSLN